MATRMRLQRQGKKGSAFYHLVITDQRNKRNGTIIEKLGTYDPNQNPAKIDINFESTLNWLEKGASPTDTVRAILSYKGLLLKKHLNKGVTKGALTQDAADKKFEAWMAEKDAKVTGKTNSVAQARATAKAAAFEAETAKREAKAKLISDKLAAASEAEVAASETAAASTTEAADTPVDAPAESAPEATSGEQATN